MQTATSGQIRIGISGWRYKGWRGSFYPADLAQRRELEFAAQRLNSIELNGTFYSLQRPESFARWFNETPDDFVFSVKGSRFVTHMLKLTRVETPLANFFAQGVLRLENKLGPILWQLPPTFQCDLDRLENFFVQLPRTHQEAAHLARHHDQRLTGRSWLTVERDRPLRHALEIRHASFVSEQFITLLRKHRIGLVVADSVEWPLLGDLTANFVYCRLHGSEQLYTSGYNQEAIEAWGRRIVDWASGKESGDLKKASHAKPPRASRRDVYVYFDNDAKVRAPLDAMRLRETISEWRSPQSRALSQGQRESP
jgi:uncharacterized protein YecE (DUF72 family)